MHKTCRAKWLSRKELQSGVSLCGSLKAVNILSAWCVGGYLAGERWVQTHLSSNPDYQAKAEGFPVPVSQTPLPGVPCEAGKLARTGLCASLAEWNCLERVQVFLLSSAVRRVDVPRGVVGPVRTLWFYVKEGDEKCHEFAFVFFV